MSTAGWIPRASSRSSSSAAASSSRAAAMIAAASPGSVAVRDSASRSETESDDEALLGAVVEVPLEQAAGLVRGLDDA